MELHDNPCPRLKSITCDGSDGRMQGHASDKPAAALLYPPILGPSDIRLISLLPGKLEEDIHCELAVYDLSSRLDYEAVSYTWADEASNVDLCKTLLVSGQSLSITRNCENALRRIRSPTDVRIIWIDAVCINQDDIDERGHQVQLMSKIYSHARHILVYIGRAANDSDFIFDSLASGTIASWDPRFKSAWKHLLQRPYWTRAWVIQETAAAYTATVICGDKMIPSTLLSNHWFFSASTTSSLKDERFFKLHILAFLTPKSSTRPTGFLNILDISRICQAKDPRDKVYAILGLVMDESYRRLTVDYNLNVEDLYIKVALDLAAQYGWANVLRRAGIKHRSIKTLPSWVPDWSHPIRDCSEMTLHQFYDEAVQYDESDNTLYLKVCRIGFSDPLKVHLFDTEAYGDFQSYDDQSKTPQRLCISLGILTHNPGLSYVNMVTHMCFHLCIVEPARTQVAMALCNTDWYCLRSRLLSVYDVVAVVVLTTAGEISIFLDSIYRVVPDQIGDPWCTLLSWTQKCSFHQIPKDVLLKAIKHEMRPPTEVDSLWQDTNTFDPLIQARLRAAETNDEDYRMLLKLNDAIWKLLVRLFLWEETHVKIT